NIGAFLTPIGAIAGIMWMSVLKLHRVKLSFFDFVRYGILISVPSICAALFGLFIRL
ncbi:MAG: arsenical efflux pump membrane protein ArsB, partial [Clostridia bacterium]|nr:arsenical efflux pump membrane protein ArsB [Clostridia bacterium]